MSRSISVALGLSSRTTRRLFRQPVFAIRPLAMPILFFVAFSGALSALTKTRGFTYYQYTAFVFVLIVYLAAVMTGIFTGFDICGDFDSGLGQRLMLAVPRRMAIVFGYLIVSFARAVLGIAVAFGVGAILGLKIKGDPAQVAAIIGFALVLNLAVTLYGAGVALRFQSAASGTLIFMPTYVAFFLTPVFVPRSQLTGWIKTVAGVNPLTPIIECGRGLMAHNPTKVGLAIACTGGLFLFGAVFAVTGMRKAERGPSGRPARGPKARRAARAAAQPQ
jgi:ABC-2 type transport system permease protein